MNNYIVEITLNVFKKLIKKNIKKSRIGATRKVTMFSLTCWMSKRQSKPSLTAPHLHKVS